MPLGPTHVACRHYAETVGVTGAGLSLSGCPAFASDATTWGLEMWQVACGQGPMVQTSTSMAAVEVHDTIGADAPSWPLLAEHLDAAAVRAVFSYPVAMSGIHLGALTFYRTAPGPLDDGRRSTALMHAASAAQSIARHVVVDPDAIEPYLRPMLRMHRATGVVMAQLGLDARDALVTIRAHSLATGELLDEVVGEILGSMLRLSLD